MTAKKGSFEGEHLSRLKARMKLIDSSNIFTFPCINDLRSIYCLSSWSENKCFTSIHRFKGKRVRVDRASEPADLYWKNIPINTIKRVKLSILTYSMVILWLLASFGINYLLGIFKNSLDDRNENRSFDIFLYWAQQFVSLVNGIITSCINVGLEFAIQELSKLEKHYTHTYFNFTVAIKLTLAMFINTGLIPYFVNIDTEDWFTRSGLVMDVFFNILSVWFLSPLLYAFSFKYLK